MTPTSRASDTVVRLGLAACSQSCNSHKVSELQGLTVEQNHQLKNAVTLVNVTSFFMSLCLLVLTWCSASSAAGGLLGQCVAHSACSPPFEADPRPSVHYSLSCCFPHISQAGLLQCEHVAAWTAFTPCFCHLRLKLLKGTTRRGLILLPSHEIVQLG